MARHVNKSKFAKSHTAHVSSAECRHSSEERRFSLPDKFGPKRHSLKSEKSEGTPSSHNTSESPRKTHLVSDSVGLKRAFWNSARANLAKMKENGPAVTGKARLIQTFTCARDTVRGVMQKSLVADFLTACKEEKAAAIENDSDTDSYDSGDIGLVHGDCFKIKNIFADMETTSTIDKQYIESLQRSSHNLQSKLNKLLDSCSTQLANNAAIDNDLKNQCDDIVARIKALEEKLQRDAANRLPASKLDEVKGILDGMCRGLQEGFQNPEQLCAFLGGASESTETQPQHLVDVEENDLDDFGEEEVETGVEENRNKRQSPNKRQSDSSRNLSRNVFSGFESSGNAFFRRKSAEIITAHRFNKRKSVPRRHSVTLHDLGEHRRQAITGSERTSPKVEEEGLKLNVASLSNKANNSKFDSLDRGVAEQKDQKILNSSRDASPDMDALVVRTPQKSPIQRSTSGTPSRPRSSPSNIVAPAQDKVLYGDLNERRRIVGDLLEELNDQCKPGYSRVSVEAVCLSRTLHAQAQGSSGWRHRIGSKLCAYPHTDDPQCADLGEVHGANTMLEIGGTNLKSACFRGVPARHHARHHAFNDLHNP